MDDQGNLYRPGEPRPADAIEVPHESVRTLEDLNHRGRKVYYSERRRGASEREALDAAILSLRA